jgi:MarR-like DNA-binding transcriptional regulator SgrR of sgrS sRNA
MLSSKLWLITFGLFLLISLSVPIIKLGLTRNGAHQEEKQFLEYVILDPRDPITLDLYEAERYEPAVVVQSLIGNLVYFSNHGRYEPRLAKQWQRVKPDLWQFELAVGVRTHSQYLVTCAAIKNSFKPAVIYPVSQPMAK